ncbi:MAG: hypothetical protein ACRDFQ_02900 [Anaerolineales bacterium]
MYNEDTELIFPLRVAKSLRSLHGEKWRKAVDKAARAKPDSAEAIGLVLAMARVNGCSSCNADSFRAMKGCTLCSQDSVRRHRGGERALLKALDKARTDVDAWL